MSPDERTERLNAEVAVGARHGWRVESQTAFQAIMVKGHRPNHLLHLILSIITLGLWVIVWILVAVSSRERRKVVSVDQAGLVSVR